MYGQGDTLYGRLIVTDAADAPADADATPTAILSKNLVDTAIPVTITRRERGIYDWTCTLTGTWATRDAWQLLFAAELEGVPLALSAGGTIDNRRIADLHDLDAADTRAALGLAAANLDTQLADLPTNAELAARTLPTANYATAAALALKATQASVDALAVTLAAIIATLADMAETIWTYARRSLTTTAAEMAATLDGSTITIQRGDTLDIELIGLPTLDEEPAAAAFTIKSSRNLDDEDAEAILQITLDGLAVLAGQTPDADQTATLEIDVDGDETTATITATAAATAALPAISDGRYDLQVIDDEGTVRTITSGIAKITRDVTRATE